MKRDNIRYHTVFFFLFIFLFFMTEVIQTHASKITFLDDREDLISEAVQERVGAELEQTSKKYGLSCLAVTDSSTGDMESSAFQYMEQIGISEDGSAVLLYINSNDNSLLVVQPKKTSDYFFEPEFNQIFYESVQELLDEEKPDFDKIIQKYGIYCESLLSSYYSEEELSQELTDYIDDQADYFSEEAKKKLNRVLAILSRNFDTDFRITAQKTFQEDTVDWAAIRYIEQNKIGEEKEDSAFLFYISQNPRKFSLMARDRAQDTFYAGVREKIFSAILPYMKEDKYEEAAEIFIENIVFYSIRNRLKKNFADEERDSSKYLFEELQTLIPENERKKLNTRLRSLSERYNMDVVIYVSDKKGLIDPYEEVYNLAIKNRLGDGRVYDTVIYYLNLKEKISLIVPRGKAGVIFTAYALDKIEPMLNFSIKSNQYQKKGHKFAKYAEDFLKMAEKGIPYSERNRYTNWSFLIFSSLSMSLKLSVVAFFFILIRMIFLLKKMSKVEVISAASYLGNPHFAVREDRYLNSTSYTVYDKDDDSGSGSSGGSSSSYSSGDSSYGGTSGDY